MELVNEVILSKPKDEKTLSTIKICLVQLKKFDLVVKMYLQANESYKEQNEEILLQLFYSYVRIKDFSNQQKIALKLFKIFKKKKYLFFYAGK
jgi:hypothetical protein